MSEEKKVTLKLSVYQAAAVRELLFREQKGYSYEFPSERIAEIRKVIINIDNQIGGIVND